MDAGKHVTSGYTFFDLLISFNTPRILCTLIAGGDPYCRLERFWIELEANVLGDHEKARKLWIDIESKQKTLSDYWITQADMER